MCDQQRRHGFPGFPGRSAIGTALLVLGLAGATAAQLSLPDGRLGAADPDGALPRLGPDEVTMLRVSVSTAGAQANGPTDVAIVSADGLAVAFSGVASNLAGDDTIGLRDVFLRDLVTGETTLVSTAPRGLPGNGASGAALALSGNGRHVAFDSWASDLVPNDIGGQLDVFVHDRATGTTERVSVDSAGTPADGPSTAPAISADGRWIAFSSWADNLVVGDDNLLEDVFLHDRSTGVTTRISEDAQGADGIGVSHSPSITPDGRFVAFAGQANNLVAEPLGEYHYVFVHDTLTGETIHASKNDFGDFAHGDCDTVPAISADGRFVAFATVAYNLVFPDLNGVSDVFVHDKQTSTTTRVSIGSLGTEGNGGSILPVMSSDGRLVAFVSGADNLVPGDSNGEADIFLHDRITGETRLVSRTYGGNSGNAASTTPSLSVDGSWLVFTSAASNLVTGDTNLVQDVFLCDAP